MRSDAQQEVCGSGAGQPGLPAKPCCGRASDRHSDSDTKASGTTMIISNKADVYPRAGDTYRNVRPKREDRPHQNVKTSWRAWQDSNPRPAA